MRVLIAAREYPPYVVGGVAIHTYRLVRALRRIGVYVDVVSFGYRSAVINEGQGATMFIEAKSSVIARSDEGPLRDLKIFADIARYTAYVDRLLRRGEYDILHVEEPYIGGFMDFDRKVTTIHDTSYGEIRAIFSSRGITSYTLRKVVFYATAGYAAEYGSWITSRAVITPSPQVRDELVYVYKLSPAKIYVIPNGVEEPDPNEPGKEEAKKILGLEGLLIVFTTAQHIPRKKLDLLLKAAALLKDKWTGKAKIIIGGDGPLTPQLIKMTRDLGLQGFVEFVGWIPDNKLPLYYRASDVFVVTSDYEAGPQTLLEAGIRGCALVSSRIPLFPALMRDGIDGVTFRPGDHVELAKALDTVLEDEGLRKRLSENAIRFTSRFAWGKIAEYTLAVYKRVVGRGSSPNEESSSAGL